MKNLSDLHPQELSTISHAIKTFKNEPNIDHHRESAVYWCGSLFTQSTARKDVYEAFSFCGMSMDEIEVFVNKEIKNYFKSAA